MTEDEPDGRLGRELIETSVGVSRSERLAARTGRDTVAAGMGRLASRYLQCQGTFKHSVEPTHRGIKDNRRQVGGGTCKKGTAGREQSKCRGDVFCTLRFAS